jgi:integrase
MPGTHTARNIRPGSLADLIGRYRASPEWDEKKSETKRDYDKALGPLERDWGHLPVAGLQRKHLGPIRDRYAWRKDKEGKRVRNARQANRVVTVLSILLSYAVDPLGWREDNPALRPRQLRTDGEGYVPWTPEQFRQFWQQSDDEWRFAGLLGLLTGQRGQDLVAMRWSDFDGASVYVAQQKGRRRIKVWVPCHPVLLDALTVRQEQIADRSPAPLTILARPDGSPWLVNAFQKAAGKAIRATGLEGIVWHGLRGAAASWAAEGEATDQAIAALLGHTQVSTTRRYSRGARQRKLAAQAVGAIVVPIGAGEDGIISENNDRTKVTNARTKSDKHPDAE